jgi:hypothetical protein
MRLPRGELNQRPAPAIVIEMRMAIKNTMASVSGKTPASVGACAQHFLQAHEIPGESVVMSGFARLSVAHS